MQGKDVDPVSLLSFAFSVALFKMNVGIWTPVSITSLPKTLLTFHLILQMSEIE